MWINIFGQKQNYSAYLLKFGDPCSVYFLNIFLFCLTFCRSQSLSDAQEIKKNKIKIKQFEQMKHLLSTRCSMVVSFYGKKGFLFLMPSMRWKTFLIFILWMYLHLNSPFLCPFAWLLSAIVQPICVPSR